MRQRMNITVSIWRVSRYGADHETPRSVDQLQVRETSALNGGSTLGARALDIGMRWRTWAATDSPSDQVHRQGTQVRADRDRRVQRPRRTGCDMLTPAAAP